MSGPQLSPAEALDFDLEGFDLFAGIDMGVQAAVLNATINFDATLFNDPILSSATVPQLSNPAANQSREEKTKEVASSASAKMALLKARLNKSKSGATQSNVAVHTAQNLAPPSVAATSTAASAAPPNKSVALPSASDSPAQNSLLKEHSPQASPSGLTQPNKPRTPGISSLIASSVLSPDLLLVVPETSVQRKSIPIYKSTQQSGPGFLNSSTEDVFAFGDEDPEETGEKLKLDEDSDLESIDHETSNGDKENAGLENTRRSGFGHKNPEPDKPSKEARKAAPSMPERDKASQETLQFSEQLMQRINERLSSNFAVVTQCEDIQCAIDSEKKNGENADRPPLPRLIIRMPKKTSEDSRRRCKKMRHYSDEDTTDEDDDWYGEKPKKRRGRRPKTQSLPENTYSSRLVDPFLLDQKRRESQVDSQAMSMKDRIMKKWTLEKAGTDTPLPDTARGVNGQVELKPLWKIVGEYKPADVRERLDMMKPCEGEVTRDTFLVLKSELHSTDCALWRVDSMSLLQKFPSFLGRSEDGELKVLYRKSTTYSGWCEQLQSNYMVVEVRPVRSRNINNRGEGIVEPLIPLVELLPAISKEAKDRCCARSSTNKVDDYQSEDQKLAHDDGANNGLSKLIRSMLSGAKTFDYFPKDLPSDSGELLNKIERLLKELQQIIADRVSFSSNFQLNLRRYSSCRVIDCENKENNCQLCEEAPVTNTIQLHNLTVDNDENEEENNNEQEEGLPAMDYHTCAECSKLARWQHSLIHFRRDLTGRIEDRLLDGTYEMPSRSPEQIIDNLRQNHAWLMKVILVNTDIWDAVLQLEEAAENERDELETDSHPTTEADPAVVATESAESAVSAAPVPPVSVALPVPAASSGFSIASLLHS